MARKAVVDKDKILGMLREGRTTQSIAEEFGVSRQAIDLHRRDFIKRGVIADLRGGRVRKSAGPEAPSGYSATAPRTPARRKESRLSLDEQIDLIIDAFGALKRLPTLEAELEEYRRELETARQEIERLRGAVQTRNDQEHRWRLLQGDGESTPRVEGDRGSQN